MTNCREIEQIQPFNLTFFFQFFLYKKLSKGLSILSFAVCLGSRTGAQPGTKQTCKMESLARRVTILEPLTIVAKPSILDVCRGPGYASAVLKFGSSRWRMFFEIGVLKITQYSQENTCAGVSFQ